jgi:hypothetical protein
VEEALLEVQTFARKSVEISDISMRNFVMMGITSPVMGVMLIASSN